MDNLFVLTETDRQELQALFESVRALTGHRPGSQPFSEEGGFPPDVYVAYTPKGGIPALAQDTTSSTTTTTFITSTTTSTSTTPPDSRPDSAFCMVFRIIIESGVAHLRLVNRNPLQVWNLRRACPVPGNTWILVVRDKAGNWWADDFDCGPTGTTTSTSTTEWCDAKLKESYCIWQWNTGTCLWDLSVTHCIGTYNCHCLIPQSCGVYGCQSALTGCVLSPPFPQSQPVCCGGTSTTGTDTTTTTTCNPNDCDTASGCFYACNAPDAGTPGTWVGPLGSCDAGPGGCNCCHCPTVTEAGLDGIPCFQCQYTWVNCAFDCTTTSTTATTTTGCQNTTTTTLAGDCPGTCSYVTIDPGDGNPFWVFAGTPSCDPGCSCPYPGNPCYIGQTATVSCFGPPTTTTTTTGTGTTTSTTACLFGNCGFLCVGTGWQLVADNCYNPCSCVYPIGTCPDGQTFSSYCGG